MTEQPRKDGLHQIGTVADRVGLSLRTIRHYDDVGIVVPTGRSTGGFRLYTDGDIERLRHVKTMKPLGFTLDETRDLIALRDRLTDGDDLTDDERGRLQDFAERAQRRCDELGQQLTEVHTVAEALQNELGAGLTEPTEAAGTRSRRKRR